jgi:hypothetical protein
MKQLHVLVGTDDGLQEIAGGRPGLVDALAGRPVIALARDGAVTWALVDGRALWRTADGRRWETVATVEGPPATCLAASPAGLLVGTEQAHLLVLAGGRLERLQAFDSVQGREGWYTPWGDPADVRSISVDPAGTIHVNVHVGGIVRSRDGGHTWAPTLDIEADVHQVLAHPGRPGVVVAAAAVGFGISRDGGDTWHFTTAGLHAHYLRAVAVAAETVLVTASTGPGGRRAAIYRRALDADLAFEQCRTGLPEWFQGNIDTACVAAAGSAVVAGTADGRVFASPDGGGTWTLSAKGLATVRCIVAG